MKPSHLLIPAFILMCCVSQAQFSHFEDTTYHFAFDYPESWRLTGEIGENLRAEVISPGDTITLFAFAFFLESGYVDIEKFAAKDTSMFLALGDIKETNHEMVIPFLGKTLSKILGFAIDGADEILAIRKSYDQNPNGYYAVSYITVDEHYAYILIAYSKSENFASIELITESFEGTTGWWTKRENDFSWAHQKKALYNVLIGLCLFLYLSGIVLSGRNYKKWSRQRVALNRFRSNLEAGKEPDQKWRYAFRRANRKMIFSVILFLVLGLPVMIYFYDVWYAYPLVLFFFFVGYMGYTLTIKEPD
ncbi:hypothetical protein ACFLS7_00925 [Bacteroidota bacterium]